ncbi:MAG: hypothetical protein JNK87_20975, partial [Bryobacterales bacterium]|nr:hypothetical protein [Bryobacterales bacterium]
YLSPDAAPGLRIALPKASTGPVVRPSPDPPDPPPTAPGHPITGSLPATPPPARPFPLWPLVGLTLLGALLPAIWIIRARLRTAPPTIALIALRNTGPDAALNPLAESWTNQLTKALLQSGAWQVAGPSPAVNLNAPDPAVSQLRRYKADAVLTGNVRPLGPRDVRISLDLLNPADGYLIWHTSFDRNLLVANEMQGIAAATLVEELTRRYTGRPASQQAQAYALAREFWSSFHLSGIEKAIPLFQQVTKADPNFAPAWAGLADAYLRLAEDVAGKIDTREQVEAARRAAQRAIQLDDTNAEGHTVLGRILLYHDWNFSLARDHLQRSLALDPSRVLTAVPLSQALTIRGDLHGALTVIQEARSRLPILPDLVMQEGSVHFLARRYEKMEEIGRELLRLEPDSSGGPWLIGLSLELRGQLSNAIREYETALRKIGRNARLECALAHAYGKAGQRQNALNTTHLYYPDLQAPLTRFSLSYCVALVYTGLGEPGPAFSWLEKARTHRDMSFPFFPSDPRFDSLKSHQQYSSLILSLR